eukprot:7839418-Ditylum_brightwellii.AAC.1
MEDWNIVKLAINHFVTNANTIHTGHSGTLVIIMQHYALLRDGFSDQWQSNSVTESQVAAFKAAITGLQTGTPKVPGETDQEGGRGDATL